MCQYTLPPCLKRLFSPQETVFLLLLTRILQRANNLEASLVYNNKHKKDKDYIIVTLLSEMKEKNNLSPNKFWITLSANSSFNTRNRPQTKSDFHETVTHISFGLILFYVCWKFIAVFVTQALHLGSSTKISFISETLGSLHKLTTESSSHQTFRLRKHNWTAPWVLCSLCLVHLPSWILVSCATSKFFFR